MVFPGFPIKYCHFPSFFVGFPEKPADTARSRPWTRWSPSWMKKRRRHRTAGHGWSQLAGWKHAIKGPSGWMIMFFSIRSLCRLFICFLSWIWHRGIPGLWWFLLWKWNKRDKQVKWFWSVVVSGSDCHNDNVKRGPIQVMRTMGETPNSGLALIYFLYIMTSLQGHSDA